MGEDGRPDVAWSGIVPVVAERHIDRMLFGYRFRGFLLIQALFFVIGLFLPRAFLQDFGWWYIGTWFLAMLWWMNKSSARHWQERDQLEADRKARIEAAKR